MKHRAWRGHVRVEKPGGGRWQQLPLLGPRQGRPEGQPSIEERLPGGAAVPRGAFFAAQRGGQLVGLRQKVVAGAQQHHDRFDVLHGTEELVGVAAGDADLAGGGRHSVGGQAVFR